MLDLRRWCRSSMVATLVFLSWLCSTLSNSVTSMIHQLLLGCFTGSSTTEGLRLEAKGLVSTAQNEPQGHPPLAATAWAKQALTMAILTHNVNLQLQSSRTSLLNTLPLSVKSFNKEIWTGKKEGKKKKKENVWHLLVFHSYPTHNSNL